MQGAYIDATRRDRARAASSAAMRHGAVRASAPYRCEVEDVDIEHNDKDEPPTRASPTNRRADISPPLVLRVTIAPPPSQSPRENNPYKRRAINPCRRYPSQIAAAH